MTEYRNHLNEMLRHMILANPERWPHREAALNTIYCESGNGLVWPEGEDLRPREGTLEDLFGPATHEVPDIEHRLKEFRKRCREEFVAFRKAQDPSLAKDQSYAEFRAWQHAQTGYGKPAPDSFFLNVPDRSRVCWFDGVREVAGEIFDIYRDVYEQYEESDREARLRNHRRKMKEETERFAQDGVLTTWLHTQSALQMQGYGFLREKDPHNLVRPGWLASEVRDAFLAQSECKDFQAFVDQRRNADPLKPIFEEFAEINAAVAVFCDWAWKGGLKRYYNASNLRGHSGIINGVQVLMWGSAGRVLITLGREGSRTPSLTLIGTDGVGDSLGIQGITATKEEALSLLQGVSEVGAYAADHLQADSKVGIG